MSLNNRYLERYPNLINAEHTEEDKYDKQLEAQDNKNQIWKRGLQSLVACDQSI